MDQSPNSTTNQTQDIFQAVFDHAIDGIIIINERGLIHNINPAALKVFQYAKEELVGKNVKTLMPEPDKSSHDKYIKNYHETGKKKIIGLGREVLGLKKDGSTFPFRLAVSEIKKEEEHLFVGVIHDLTKEKEAEEKLKNYTHNLESLIEERTNELQNSQQLSFAIAKNFPNGTVSVLDENLCFKFTEGNEWKRRIKNAKDVIGMCATEVFPVEDTEELKKDLRKALEGEKVVFSYKYKQKYYDVIARLLQNPVTNQKEILLVETNVTEQKVAELEISNALNKERALHEMKSRFVSMASHEFRTPLSTILSSASLLDKYTEQNKEKSSKHINRIKSNVQNLNQILEDFLSIDKLSEGKLRVNNSNFNIVELFQTIVEELSLILKPNQKINLQYDIEKEEVRLDQHLLRNVLLNVISNSIKYSEKDINVTIHENDILSIAIIDQGIGIPEREQEQLFQRFFRAENALNIKGTGLGLHIVKDI